MNLWKTIAIGSIGYIIGAKNTGIRYSYPNYNYYNSNKNNIRQKPLDRFFNRVLDVLFLDGEYKPSHRKGPSSIAFDTRSKAESALNKLVEIMDECGNGTISDFYDILGINSMNYSDTKYGWTNSYHISNSSIYRKHDGKYYINFPPAQRII